MINSIDAGLDAYGVNLKAVVHRKMKVEWNLSKEDVAMKPEEFKTNLDNMFGPGARLIERSIAKHIAIMFEFELSNSFDLVGAISQARSMISPMKAVQTAQ